MFRGIGRRIGILSKYKKRGRVGGYEMKEVVAGCEAKKT